MDSLSQLLGTVAPWIGTALGGPLGGAAAKAIVSALGLPEATANSTKELSAAILGASPEQLAALKKADQDFQVQMTTLGFQNLKDMEALAVQDRASARDREIKTGDKTTKIIALLVVTAWGLIQWYLLSHIVADVMRDIIMRMLGTMDAALMMILSYYFGSSRGSEAKNQVINDMAKGDKNGSST